MIWCFAHCALLLLYWGKEGCFGRLCVCVCGVDHISYQRIIASVALALFDCIGVCVCVPYLDHYWKCDDASMLSLILDSEKQNSSYT